MASRARRLFTAALLCLPAWATAQCVSDEVLNNLAMRSGNDTGTLVYVWSPRMVLSLTQAHLAAQAAEQFGLDFLPVHDARVPPTEIASALKAAQKQSPEATRFLSASQALCSPQLLQAEALRHFPTAYVLTARGTHRFPIVGAMPLAAWQQSIAQRWAKP